LTVDSWDESKPDLFGYGFIGDGLELLFYVLEYQELELSL